MNTADRISNIRKSKGMSQEELADQAAVVKVFMLHLGKHLVQIVYYGIIRPYSR